MMGQRMASLLPILHLLEFWIFRKGIKHFERYVEKGSIDTSEIDLVHHELSETNRGEDTVKDFCYQTRDIEPRQKQRATTSPLLLFCILHRVGT